MNNEERIKRNIEQIARSVYIKNGWDKKATEQTWFVLNIRRLCHSVDVTLQPYMPDIMGEMKNYFGSGATEKEALLNLESSIAKDL